MLAEEKNSLPGKSMKVGPLINDDSEAQRVENSCHGVARKMLQLEGNIMS
jgi:hypothetical protein